MKAEDFSNYTPTLLLWINIFAGFAIVGLAIVAQRRWQRVRLWQAIVVLLPVVVSITSLVGSGDGVIADIGEYLDQWPRSWTGVFGNVAGLLILWRLAEREGKR